MADLVWNNLTQKPSSRACNFIPQMPTKFVERAFLVGGFVGSKSQAGTSPSRAYISLSDVIFEQLFLRSNLSTKAKYNLISGTNCESTKKMVTQKLPMQNFSCNCSLRNNHGKEKVDRPASFFSHFRRNKNGNVKSKCTNQAPVTKHIPEELVYEDKDEGGNSIYVYQEVQKSTCEVTKTSLFHVRSRTISDCSIESDDSFIIFESNDNEGEEEPDALETFEYEDSSSDESNECDEVDYLASVPESHTTSIDSPLRVAEANNKWNELYKSTTGIPKFPKKVSFANGKELAHVHTMVKWDYAHRAARKGPWETLALDRSRFSKKIQELSNNISPILDQTHRKKIFQQRFQQL